MQTHLSRAIKFCICFWLISAVHAAHAVDVPISTASKETAAACTEEPLRRYGKTLEMADTQYRKCPVQPGENLFKQYSSDGNT